MRPVSPVSTSKRPKSPACVMPSARNRPSSRVRSSAEDTPAKAITAASSGSTRVMAKVRSKSLMDSARMVRLGVIRPRGPPGGAPRWLRIVALKGRRRGKLVQRFLNIRDG